MHCSRQLQLLQIYHIKSSGASRFRSAYGERSPFTQQSLKPLRLRPHSHQSGTLKGRCKFGLSTAASSMSGQSVNHQQIKSDWAKRGFSFGVFVDPPGQIWPDFTHRTDELVMLTKGEFELTFNGRCFRPSIGEEVLIPAKALHTVENTGDMTNEWLYGYKNR